MIYNTVDKTIMIPYCFHFVDNQISQLVDDGAKLDRYLFGRHVPLEQTEMFSIKKQIERDIISKNTEIDRISKLGKRNMYKTIFKIKRSTK